MASFWEGGWKYALLILVFPDKLLFEIQEQSRSCTEGQVPPSTKAATQQSAEGCSGRQTLKARDNILIFDSHLQLYWQVYTILNSTHTTGVAAVSGFIKRWNSGLHILVTAAEPKYYQGGRNTTKNKKVSFVLFHFTFWSHKFAPPCKHSSAVKKKTEQTSSNQSHWMLH